MAPASKTSKKKKGSLTPMMRQYMAIKEQNPDTLLLYRMGDFFELFFEDAKIASAVLGLTLTSRNHGGTDETPLAGFPHHALDRYANRLVRAGHRIAICEQVEDPKTAKGVVKRDVVEVVTAGTATEDSFIDERSNNYICALSFHEQQTGMAICDLSTGEFMVQQLSRDHCERELVRIEPSEIVIPHTGDEMFEAMKEQVSAVVTRLDVWKFASDTARAALCDHFSCASLDGMGLEGYTAGIEAAGALLSYLKEQKRNDLRHISRIVPRSLGTWAELDPATIRNLELLRPLQTGESGGTLLSVLDKTSSAMGARLLKRWITHPLVDIGAINERLDGVAWLKKDVFVRGELRLLLRRVADIERIIGRVSYGRANARDLCGLCGSFSVFPDIVKNLASTNNPLMTAISADLSGFEDMKEQISSTVVESPPLSIRDGGIIREKVSAELDDLRDAAHNGKQWIARLQESERERTGIQTLKVGYNKVFGYYIEVSKANSGSVPEDYHRKQTLVGGERYITPELKEMEAKVLGAQERLGTLEYELFCELRAAVAQHCGKVQAAADALARLDVMLSLAVVAAENNFNRPVLMENTDLIIREGRHPVVETMNPAEEFIPNDTDLYHKETQIFLITGPNMAGKSTYLRQNALIALMAQIGSFVPAAAAQVGVVDKFFTRVGASDRLARGQSTFLVEMIEVANILNNATDRSLVLLDEVGRGTSTFDGISIAWAVAEYLHRTTGRKARTFFATHYHELTELELLFPRIKNLHVKIKEWNDKIIFLRKVETGSCDHSYGIQVARLAGVPRRVIDRAKEILANLETMELTPEHKPALASRRSTAMENVAAEEAPAAEGVQLNLMDSFHADILSRLRSLDANELTPLHALNILSELIEKAAQG